MDLRVVHAGAQVEARSDARVPITIGVVGHRDIPRDTVDDVVANLRDVIQSYRTQCPNSPILLLSALATGADQLAVQACEGIPDVRIMAMLPMPREDYEDDFAPPGERDQFRRCLDKAWRVIELPGVENDRDASYQECARFISGNSHVLVAVWDGRAPEARGGTADTVYYRIPGLLSLNGSGAARGDGGSRGGQTLHLPSSRSSHGEAPVAIDGMPASDAVMECLPHGHWHAWPGAGSDRSAVALDQLNCALSSADEPSRIAGRPNPVTQHLRDVCDQSAGRDQRSFRRLAASVLTLGAVSLILVGWQQKTSSLWTLLFLGLTIVILGGSWWVMSRLRIKHRFQEERVIAEGARVQDVWLQCDIETYASDHYLQHQSDVGWIRNALQAAWLLDATDPSRAEALERSAGSFSAVEPGREWISGQVDYFAGTASRKGALQRNGGRARLYSTLSALGLGVALLTLLLEVLRAVGVEVGEGITALGQSGWEVGLALAAACTAYAELMAFREVGRRYGLSLALFQSGKAQLAAITGGPCTEEAIQEVRSIVTEVGVEALQETSAWYATTYDRSVRPV